MLWGHIIIPMLQMVILKLKAAVTFPSSYSMQVVQLPSSGRLSESKVYPDIYYIIGVGGAGTSVCLCDFFVLFLSFSLLIPILIN